LNLHWLTGLLIINTLWSCPNANGETPRPAILNITSAIDRYEVGSYLTILADPSGELSIDEVANDQQQLWRPSDTNVPSFGYSDSAYWFRLKVEGLDRLDEWILEIAYPPLDETSLYYRQENGTWIAKHTGDQYDFSGRDLGYRNPLFVISGENITELYLRVKSTGVVKVPVNLSTVRSFTEQSIRSTYFLGLYFGIMLVMILYNLCIFFSTKELSYLYYVLYISSFGFAMLALNGLGFQLLWPNYPGLNQYMIPVLEALSLATLAVFTSNYLNTKSHTPRLHIILNLLKVYALVTVAAAFFGGYEIAIKLVTLGVLIFVVYVFIVGAVSFRMGYRPARYFLIAFSSLLIGAFLFALSSAGLIPSNFITNYGLQIGSLMEVVLLSLGLADKMNLAQEKADAINRQLIADLQQREQDQINSNEKIKKLNLDLIEKEMARTAFFHNTSHELRTPLNGIIGYVELMKQPVAELPKKAVSQVLKIGMLAESLKNQVNTILDLAKSRRGELRLNISVFLVDELVEEIKILIDGLKYRHPNTSFILNYQQEEGRRFCFDREKLVIVIRNILSNAFKFREIDKPNSVELDLKLLPGNELYLQVRDTGIGIPENQIESVFLEFHQVSDDARRSHEGTGIGLSMVKTVVDLAGGRLNVQSRLGIGTCFQVWIPSQEQIAFNAVNYLGENSLDRTMSYLSAIRSEDENREVPSNPIPSVLTKAETDKYRIVLIDDNYINCEVISEILRGKCYQVDCAMGGREGLAMIRDLKPDLILLDLMMPEVSGEDVLRELKSDLELNQIPVIILTARASQEDKNYSLTLGADDYLAKPVVTEEMLLRVKNVIARLDLARSQSEQETLAKNLAAAQKFYISMQNLSSRLQGVEISSYYCSAEIAGGDWIGVKHDEKNNLLYAVIGDVTGHGMVSALLTVATAGAMNGCLHMMGTQAKLPAAEGLRQLANAVNRVVFDLGQIINRCMTMCFICIDMERGELAYLNAGHNPVYLVRNQKIIPILKGGLPLGMSRDTSFGQRTIDLQQGDTIFLYTDGLIENRGPNGESLAIRAVEKILKAGASPEHTKKKILKQGSVIWQQEVPEDDCSFLIIQWRDSSNKSQVA